MSFLNPVNKPVLRFKSTDASAPQINYNARVAGDVKAVLKSCLVTGYGATASAGWSIVNEVDHVAEFVSPSAAMSDYRIGVDDESAANTGWHYYYQNVRTDPSFNVPTKSFTNADKVNPANGWQLLVTERGIIFIETVWHTAISKLSSRITYWGAVKSALNDTVGVNACFFNIGHNATTTYAGYFFDKSNYHHVSLSGYSRSYMSAAVTNALSADVVKLNLSIVDLVSPIYIASSTKDLLLAQLPPMLATTISKTADLYSIKEVALDGRNMLSVCAGYGTSTVDDANRLSRTFLIPLDYWEY